MGRIARAVAAGFPHHVTQRGNRRMQTFFGGEDYALYVALLSERCRELGVEVWAYCLMPNHVHLVVAPETEDGLRRAIGDAHRRYTRRVNFREGWRGHLWQGRFASFVMDEDYLLAATRYVELNPVRAGLAKSPWGWKWSSARAHRKAKDDALVTVRPMLQLVSDWEDFLGVDPTETELREIRKHERTGRPLGAPVFLRRIERKLKRALRPGKPGPKPGSRKRGRKRR